MKYEFAFYKGEIVVILFVLILGIVGILFFNADFRSLLGVGFFTIVCLFVAHEQQLIFNRNENKITFVEKSFLGDCTKITKTMKLDSLKGAIVNSYKDVSSKGGTCTKFYLELLTQEGSIDPFNLHTNRKSRVEKQCRQINEFLENSSTFLIVKEPFLAFKVAFFICLILYWCLSGVY